MVCAVPRKLLAFRGDVRVSGARLKGKRGEMSSSAGDAGDTGYLGSMWNYGSSIVNSIMGWESLEVVKTSEDGAEEAGSSGKAGTMEERQAMFKALTSYIGKDVQSLV